MFLADRYYQKLGIRNGLAVSGAVMALAFVLFCLASKYWQYCLASAITGIAYGMGTMIPIAILLNRWFRRSSDTAIGICSAVTGISTLGIPSLLSHSIDTSGLRLTFCAEAAVIGLLTLLCLCLLRNTPEEMGLLPYGAESEQSAETLRPPKEKDVQRHDLKCPELVIMIVMLILTGGVMNVSYSHLAVLITGEGLSESTAAISMSMSGLSLMLGKVAYGRLEDLWGTVRCNYVFAPIFLFGLALCSFIGSRPSLLYPAVVLYSFGISYMSVGISTWPAELSSTKRHSRLIQLFQIGYVSGSLVFSPLPGILADRSGGSYAGAFRLFLILGVIVFITVQTILIRHNKKPLSSKGGASGFNCQIRGNYILLNKGRSRAL